MTYDSTTSDSWSPTGQTIAWAIMIECALAVTAISHAEFHRPRILVVAVAVTIASAILAARSRMPAQAKAVLITLACTALLALAAAQDPFGLRAIDRRIEDATGASNRAEASVAVDAHADVAIAASHVTLRGKGDTAAAIFADDLARSVAIKSGDDIGAVHVDGVIDVSAGAGGDSYRLIWSLARQSETVWCGRIIAIGQARAAAIDSFSTTIAAALRRARGGALACS